MAKAKVKKRITKKVEKLKKTEKEKKTRKTPLQKIDDDLEKDLNKKINKFKKQQKKKKGKNKGGRPQFDGKPIESVLVKLGHAFALDATIDEASAYAGISADAYYKFVKKYPEFLDEFNRLRENPILLARQSVILGMKHDGALALKYLERKRKDEFSTKTITSGEIITGEMSEAHKNRVEEILKENGELNE